MIRAVCSLRLALFLLVSMTGLGTVPAVRAETPASHPGDPRISALINELAKTQLPRAAAISPDGTAVAWTARTSNGTELHLTEIASPHAGKDIAIDPGSGSAECSNSSPRWSPDGQWLAFISNCAEKTDKPGQAQVFLWSRETGLSRRLTQLTGGIDSLAWSPDGRSLGLLYIENATRSAGALAAMKPRTGVIGEDGLEIQRVAVIDPATGALSELSPTTLHVYEFDWSPDSKHLVFVAANPPGENNWWVAQLYTQDLTPKAQPRPILNTVSVSGSLHGLQIAVPRWSPDGRQIAFIGGLMSDQGVTGGDVYVIPAEGGEPRNITPGRSTSVAYIGWVTPSILGIAEHVGGSSHITALNVSSGNDVSQIDTTFPETIGAGGLGMSISISQRRTIAIIRSSFEQPPEVWAGSVNHLKQITHLNDGLRPSWGRTEDVEWTNDGFKVQGWLLYPSKYDPAKRYPLLVDVHGGPSSATTPRWPGVGYGAVPFSALDYFVFMPNPRGSYGQGERFTQANVRDFGYGDLRDILAGIDVLENVFPSTGSAKV